MQLTITCEIRVKEKNKIRLWKRVKHRPYQLETSFIKPVGCKCINRIYVYVVWCLYYEHLLTCNIGWVKRDQLDITCFIISLLNVQHVSDVNTSILRSLWLICWVISWVVLLWFDVCWCYVVVWLWWCGTRMQAEALVPQPAYGYHTTTAKPQRNTNTHRTRSM